MLIIRQPTSVAEHEEGIALIRQVFNKKFGTSPKELPEQLFVAYDDGVAVGTLSVQTSFLSPTFEVEKYFDCNISDFYQGSRLKVGEIGRLTALKKGVGQFLFCAAVIFAKKNGIEFFLSFNKKSLTQVLDSSDYQFHVETRSIPIKANIPKEYHQYFFGEEEIVVLTQFRKNWEARVRELIKQKGVEIRVPNKVLKPMRMSFIQAN